MINRDFRDLFAAFAAREVRFLVVGGYAVAYHGHPRFTKDVDVLVDPDAANARRVFQALADFGAPSRSRPQPEVAASSLTRRPRRASTALLAGALRPPESSPVLLGMTNATKLRPAGPLDGIALTDFSDPESVLQIGVPPNRIDVLTAISGLEFQDAWSTRVPAHYGDVPIAYLGFDALLRSKRAAGRPQDLLDVQALTQRREPERG